MGTDATCETEDSETTQENALRRTLARSHMRHYLRYTNPAYKPTWATELIADRLTRIGRRIRGRTGPGTLDALYIKAPPQHFKSFMVSEEFPGFVATQDPRLRGVGLSHNRALAKRAVQAVSGRVGSKSFREISRACAGRVTSLNANGDETTEREEARSEMVRFMVDWGGGEIEHGPGYYKAAGVNSELTGWGYEYGICDDLVKGPVQAFAPGERAKLESIVRSVFFTRRQEHSAMVVVMTPWHPEDIGHKIVEWWDKAGLNYEILSFPAEAAADVALHPEDPRVPGSGEWLDLVRHTPEFYRAQRALVGPLFWRAMYQQDPRAFLGSLVPASMWPRFDPQALVTQLAVVIKLILSIDPNESEGGKSHAHLSLWAVVMVRGVTYLWKLDQKHGPWDYGGLRANAMLMISRWPSVTDILIEHTAMGPALVTDLEQAKSAPQRPRGYTIHKIHPAAGGSKPLRAAAATPAIVAGLCCLPLRAMGKVTDDWTEAHGRAWQEFPAGLPGDSDLVDADGQCIRWTVENRYIDIAATETGILPHGPASGVASVF